VASSRVKAQCSSVNIGDACYSVTLLGVIVVELRYPSVSFICCEISGFHASFYLSWIYVIKRSPHHFVLVWLFDVIYEAGTEPVSSKKY
jgi:hypothetical protein